MDNDLKLEEFEVRCSEEHKSPRTIKVWKLYSDKTPTDAMTVVISSGFGRAMDQMSALATNLVANGAIVYRYDSLDHVGMSDGEMIDFTLSAGLQSLTSVVDWVVKQHSGKGVVLVSTSLTARIAYRLASLTNQISLLVTAVGVVNVRKTLECVIGEDYSTYAEDDLPPTVAFERQEIGSLGFYRNWFSKEKTLEELKSLDIPISAFIASEDEWIDRGDIEEAINPQLATNRSIYIMESCAHNFGKNLRSTEYFMNSVVELVCEHALPKDCRKPIQANFEEILNQSIKERRIQHMFKRNIRNQNVRDVEQCEEASVV
jgi:acyl transferase